MLVWSTSVSLDSAVIYLRIQRPAVGLAPRPCISYRVAVKRGCLPAYNLTFGFNLQICMPDLLQLFPLQSPCLKQDTTASLQKFLCNPHKTGKNNTAAQLRLAVNT